jgi:hypothetical protein
MWPCNATLFDDLHLEQVVNEEVVVAAAAAAATAEAAEAAQMAATTTVKHCSTSSRSSKMCYCAMWQHPASNATTHANRVGGTTHVV